MRVKILHFPDFTIMFPKKLQDRRDNYNSSAYTSNMYITTSKKVKRDSGTSIDPQEKLT